MWVIVAGIAVFFVGVILMILGQIWALAVIGLGFVGLAYGVARMYRASGYRSEEVLFNGFGNGRQQSEVVKDPLPGSGEQPANIWEQVENQ
jgi:hypothetical protein